MTDSEEQPKRLQKPVQDAGRADHAKQQPPRSEGEQPPDSPTAESDPDGERKPKGLWEVMGRRQPVADDSQANSSNRSDREHSAAGEQTADDGASQQEPYRTEQDAGSAQATGAVAGDDAIGDDADTERPKGLWAVMGSPPVAEKPARDEPADFEKDAPAVRPAENNGDDRVSVLPPVVEDEAPAFKRIARGSGRSWNAVSGCVLGTLALPLSALAIVPELSWTIFPATGMGFLALILGLLAWQEIRRSRGRITGQEMAGVGSVLGVLAMFLGPLVFAAIGRSLGSASGRERTSANMQAMGRAVLAYHDEHGRFPAGGTYRYTPEGRQIPLHSWMTALLPYMGHQQVYRSIDFDLPYDGEQNLPAMRTQIPEFLAAGNDRRTTGRHRLAVSHFAGVGGEIRVEEVGLAAAGIFGPNSEVTRGQITDGPAQTLIAGEISYALPPWGEPGNWRTVGRGLCRERVGFCNAEGSGALFLRADGSVRFFSKQTPREVLQKLSTRDAGDRVPKQYR